MTAPPDISLAPPRILPFTEAHVAGALLLSQAAGWPHRAEDWALNLTVSKGVVALQEGRVVGTALASILGDVATLNMIIVDESLRGRGLGRALMSAAMEAAGPREMRLVATPDGQPLYEKLGFVVTGSIRQYQGIARPAQGCAPLRAGTVSDLAACAAMDHAASGLDRAALMARILSDGGCLLLAEGGFALLRAFGRGEVLGPVVAADAEGARALIAGAVTARAGRFLRLDLPGGTGLDPLAIELGLAPAGDGTAMTRPAAGPGAPTRPSGFHTFALLSQALG